MKNNRLVGVFLALSLLSSCAAPPSNQTDDPAQPSWEDAELFLSYASDMVTDDFALDLGERMLSASEGRIYCNVYNDSQMGSDSDLIRSVQTGAISVAQSATSVQMELVPQLALLDTPYLFSDTERCNAQLRESLVDFFQPYYHQAGLQLLFLYCQSFRQLSCTFPLETPEQLSDLNIRTMDNRYHQLYWSAIGAEPSVVPFYHLFYAAQQGSINAQENPPAAILSIGLQKLQPYLVLTNHIPYISAVVMNKELYDSLSPQDQQAILEVFDPQTSPLKPPLTQQELEDYFQAVLTPSEELLAALKEGAAVVREALAEDLGEDVTREFYALVDPN
jgi:TRAP-type C4-dicarboxylate transport system substrate-binding protein